MDHQESKDLSRSWPMQHYYMPSFPCSAILSGISPHHDCAGHPETESRMPVVLSGLTPGIGRIYGIHSPAEALARVHSAGYIRMIAKQCEECPPAQCRFIEHDTYLTKHSFDAASHAAGGAMVAARQAINGTHAIALVRPPGHHAGRQSPMGFCIFNNAAVAAATGITEFGLDRVAIVDWDVHHGNGTQEIFYSTDTVLYCSVHQAHHYPGSGWPEQTGTGVGRGFTVNVPLPQGSGLPEYSEAFETTILPALTKFEPELVIVSAGQDCLYDDPLGNMELKPADFGIMTKMILDAIEQPLAVLLEGGYGPSHGQAVASIIEALRTWN